MQAEGAGGLLGDLDQSQAKTPLSPEQASGLWSLPPIGTEQLPKVSQPAQFAAPCFLLPSDVCMMDAVSAHHHSFRLHSPVSLFV